MTFHILGKRKSKLNFSKVLFSALSFSQSKKGNADVLPPSLRMPSAFLSKKDSFLQHGPLSPVEAVGVESTFNLSD
jgi:hypothetical protein